MSVLRNLESKIEALVEGAFSRAFRSEVQPVEIAHKLAREMEENKTVSVSKTYVPNDYKVYLSTKDREHFASYESALTKELSDYLLEHARSEGFSLVTRPAVAFETDDHLGVGEFGIQARLLDPPAVQDAGAAAAPEPSEADFGHTMVYSATTGERRRQAGASRRALLVGNGKRTVLGGSRVVLGRSADCDVVVDDPNVSRRHAELRRSGEGWVVADLGSTNGVKVNGRRVSEAALTPGDEVVMGLARFKFEEE